MAISACLSHEGRKPAFGAKRHQVGRQASAIKAIDTFMPGMRTGIFAPWRAGGSLGNHLSHSSLAGAKSSSSATISVALTAFSRLLPAASRIAAMLRRRWAT